VEVRFEPNSGRTRTVSSASANGSEAACRRRDCEGLLLALFGPRAVPDLSPQCAPKRKSANAYRRTVGVKKRSCVKLDTGVRSDPSNID
jgi:hypothetical protein